TDLSRPVPLTDRFNLRLNAVTAQRQQQDKQSVINRLGMVGLKHQSLCLELYKPRDTCSSAHDLWLGLVINTSFSLASDAWWVTSAPLFWSPPSWKPAAAYWPNSAMVAARMPSLTLSGSSVTGAFGE